MLKSRTSSRRSPPGNLVILAALSLLIVHAAGTTAAAQEPALYDSARAELASGDTLTALELLRRLTRERGDFAPGWGLLGIILGERAGGIETAFTERREADRALRRAWELDHTNPAYLMALGQLMRKQQMYYDARRVLNRAKKYMEERPEEEIEPAELAFLWFELALYAEDIYLDTRNLVAVPNLPVMTPECSNMGAFCTNFTRPRDFNEHFMNAPNLSEEGEDDYIKMVEALRRVLDADPVHAGAFRRLTIHQIERGELAEARQIAERFREDVPDNPWGYMTLGLVYYRMGLDSLAEDQFDQGIALAGPDIAGHYRDMSYVLRERLADEYHDAGAETRRWVEDVIWRKSDPLYLSPANEVRVAHLGRVSFADIWFEDPGEGRWGADSERGSIYVRYGPPERIWQIRRDAALTTSPTASVSPQGGGRWIFWNYGWDLPNFIFEKQMRFRRANHMVASVSKSMEEDARKTQPAIYTASFDLYDYPAQVARFRGAADSIIEVEMYTEAPAEKLIERPDTIDLGLFLFAGADFTEVFRRALRAPVEPKPVPLTYSLPLTAGTYTYSLEARASDSAAAVKRDSIVARPFLDGELALSDLVLANAVTPLTPEPLDRRGFAIQANRRLVFDRDLPVAVYWEVYGLATDPEGYANYEVELSVTDTQGKGVVARVAGAFGFGEGDEIELSYERVVQFNGQRVPEYISIELVESEPGDYMVKIEVRDLIAGNNFSARRIFQLIVAE